MTAPEITAQLRAFSASDDLIAWSTDLTERWISAGVGSVAIDPVLRFMEDHPEADFGVPGPFVHFLERLYGRGYEELLIESVRRRPTSHTIWMINRIINAKRSPDERMPFIAALEHARRNPLADGVTLEQIGRYLEGR